MKSIALIFSLVSLQANGADKKVVVKKQQKHQTIQQESMMPLYTIVIPAAGFGTRFLPFAKAVPKEMLPLVNEPAIQKVVEEGIATGINQFTIITSKEKQALANHFDSAPELEQLLKQKDKGHLLASIDAILQTAEFTYIRQHHMLGLGHAVSLARHMINHDYFGVILPDDIILSNTPAIGQLAQISKQYDASVIAVMEVPDTAVSSYGVIEIKAELAPGVYEIARLVEKPSVQEAPSRLAIVGRYVLSSQIFDAIDKIAPHSVGEIQLTDAIDYLVKHGHRVIACQFEGTRYDIGTPSGWLKLNVQLGLDHQTYGTEFAQFLKDIVANMQARC